MKEPEIEPLQIGDLALYRAHSMELVLVKITEDLGDDCCTIIHANGDKGYYIDRRYLFSLQEVQIPTNKALIFPPVKETPKP